MRPFFFRTVEYSIQVQIARPSLLLTRGSVSAVELFEGKEATPWWPWLLVILGAAIITAALILWRRNIWKGGSVDA